MGSVSNLHIAFDAKISLDSAKVSPASTVTILHSSTETMTYQDQLTPWIIYQLLPNAERQIVTRFRRRHDVDGYLKVLKQTRPNAEFVVGFMAKTAPTQPSSEDSPEQKLIKA